MRFQSFYSEFISMENNRKRPNSGSSRKDKKKFYKPAAHHRAIIDKTGLLVFCARKEVKRSSQEVINLCNEVLTFFLVTYQYVEKLYPTLESEERAKEETKESISIEDDLRKEIESLKNKKKKKSSLFEMMDPGIGTMYFIAFNRTELDPVKITKAILTDIETEKSQKTRFRIYITF